MIPEIREINFGPGTAADYATLHQATVSFEQMGERTISTQVRIDGDVVPNFEGWELEFRGERFVLPTLKPQASKDNSTKNSLIDLVFTSSAIYDLKRYFFAEMTEITAGTMMIDKYIASLRLNLHDFVAAFNRVLEYYFPDGRFTMDLNPSFQDPGVKDFPIDYMYIWDVLMKVYEVYGVTWNAVTNSLGVTSILVGYDAGEIDDHLFEYGFEGGLLRFERHVEDTDIYNVLLGRGGEKNLPYRYFKGTDQHNPVWAADPDAIPELQNVYFSKLLDANFRRYVQGWRAQHYGDTYDPVRAQTDWAYQKGYTDTKFDPVEYVKDDESIALYGVRQGKLDDDEDIFPTIQGVWLNNIGRADEVVDVEVASDSEAEAADDQVISLPNFYARVDKEQDYQFTVITSENFTVPAGYVGRLESAWYSTSVRAGRIDTINSAINVIDSLSNTYTSGRIPAGTYRIQAEMSFIGGPLEVGPVFYANYISGVFGLSQVKIHCTPTDQISYRQKFTIWIKNLWETTQHAGESDIEYIHRVWDPILGDKLGNAAAVSFSDGFMSMSADYEFLIAKTPEIDRTRTLTTVDRNGNTITVPSEWKLTLLRSDAEYEATGLYIPNTQTGGLPVAGNHFFFTGIDLPFQYVKWAEERLTEKKEAELDTSAQTNPTWVVSLDKVRAHTLEDNYGNLLADKLEVGKRIRISDARFTPGDVLTLAIRTIQFTWNEPSNGNPFIVPDIEVTLSEKIESTRDYDTVKSEVDTISKNYVDQSDVRKMIIKTRSSDNYAAGDILLGETIGTVQD